ncbi:MAG: EI24 domain-containing protein [Desulfobacterales bacterium]|nr:EI24 domain-containing protein [Desulfobacterales bacterium]
MGVISGIRYNIRGLALAVRTPSLLVLGLIRFLVVLLLTLVLSGMILYWHDEILAMVWQMPENPWLVYLWHGVSWILSLVLAALAMVVSYLVAQVFFCVFIMDYMSQITERMVLGDDASKVQGSMIEFFFYLIRQEIPRAVVPVIISMVLLLMGLFTPLSIFVLVISSVAASLFLAWDNTDLVPARRMVPFRERVGFLKSNLGFHLGFGLLFLIPWLNILFLSFAPVGATLYVIEREQQAK